MTIFIDPYHTTAGMTLDTSRVKTPLRECTVLDPLTGTNLGVRSANGITPVFITGCRDSERRVPPFTHPILIKNSNGKAYLFTDMRLFVSAGADLSQLDSSIRRRDEFEFNKFLGIACLAWTAGEIDRFSSRMRFAAEVYATWLSGVIATNYGLDFVAQTKVKLLAFAFYQGLFEERSPFFAKDEEKCILFANDASQTFKIPFTQVIEFYRGLEEPMTNIHDLCGMIVSKLDNVNLNPIPGRPETGFNFRVLLNLVSDSWFSTNSKLILSVCLEHPPTLCSIIYKCINFSNFKRQKLGQIIQAQGRGGKADKFNTAFSYMVSEYLQPDQTPIPVMEFLNPETFLSAQTDTQLAMLMNEFGGETDQNGYSKDMGDTYESGEQLNSVQQTCG